MASFDFGIKPPKDKAERKQWNATMKAQAKIHKALGFENIDQPAKKPMKPPRFPMKFRVFLRHMFGGRLHVDRLQLFKKFILQEMMHHHDLRGLYPHAKEAAAIVMRDKLIQELSQNGVHDVNWYFRTSERLVDWRKENRHQQRIDANNSRWEKERAKRKSS